ncbi:MAG: hypothetical protein OEZ34_05650 [Spirochaetia bacterium]|nr:hypothetical protein [Spirochaetia bacterium]
MKYLTIIFLLAANIIFINDIHAQNIPDHIKIEPYFKNLLIQTENIATFDYQKFEKSDLKRVKNLSRETLIKEALSAQNLAQYYLNDYILVEEKGIKIYDYLTSLKMALFEDAFRFRYNRLWDFNGCYLAYYRKHYDSGKATMDDELHWADFKEYKNIRLETGILAKKEKQVNINTVVNAIKDLQYPKNVTDRITIVLSPFEDTSTNGMYMSNDDIISFRPHPKWRVGPTTIAHEIGHAVQYRVFPGKSNYWKKYWKMREVDPIKGQRGYPYPIETVAEDLRVLYGGSDQATIKRRNTGKYGDIRDYPEKHEEVKKFLDKIIFKYRPSKNKNENNIYTPILINKFPGWIYKYEDKKIFEFEILTKNNYHVSMTFPGKKGIHNTIRGMGNLKKGKHTIDFNSIRQIKKNGKLAPGRYDLLISSNNRDLVNSSVSFKFYILDKNNMLPPNEYCKSK